MKKKVLVLGAFLICLGVYFQVCQSSGTIDEKIGEEPDWGVELAVESVVIFKVGDEWEWIPFNESIILIDFHPDAMFRQISGEIQNSDNLTLEGRIYLKYKEGKTSLLKTFTGRGLVKTADYKLTRDVDEFGVVGRIHTDKPTSLAVIFFPSYAESMKPVYEEREYVTYPLQGLGNLLILVGIPSIIYGALRGGIN